MQKVEADQWWGLRPLLCLAAALGYTSFVNEHSSWVGKVWSLTAAILQLTGTGFLLGTYIAVSEPYRLEDKAIDMALCAMSHAPAICLIVTLLFRAQACPTLRGQLRAADCVLFELRSGTRPPYIRQRLGIVLQVALVYLFLLCLIPSFIFSWHYTWYICLAIISAKIYVITQILVYINIVLLLRDMFAEMNRGLERLPAEKEPPAPRGNKSLLHHLGSIERESLFADEEHLQRLQAVHLHLSDACASVNAIFGPSLLLTFVLKWGMLIYALYSMLVQKALYSAHDVLSLCGLLHLCAVSAVTVATLCFCSASAAAEARRTTLLLVRPLALPARSLAPARRLRLQLFLQQARNAPARFSCCDVFDVDLPFLTSFVATLLGYVVILVQMASTAANESQH